MAWGIENRGGGLKREESGRQLSLVAALRACTSDFLLLSNARFDSRGSYGQAVGAYGSKSWCAAKVGDNTVEASTTWGAVSRSGKPDCHARRQLGERSVCTLVVAFTIAGVVMSILTVPARRAAAAVPCLLSGPSARAARRTLVALSSPRDVLGDRLLEAPGGASAAAARALLPPLFFARAARQTALTESGAYYLPFAEAVGALGAGAVALHLADGSEIVSQRIGGRSLALAVGVGGTERYGSCLTRLGTPALAEGYLPILETRYVDGSGAIYRQESFAATLPNIRGLVSFVRLRVTRVLPWGRSRFGSRPRRAGCVPRSGGSSPGRRPRFSSHRVAGSTDRRFFMRSRATASKRSTSRSSTTRVQSENFPLSYACTRPHGVRRSVTGRGGSPPAHRSSCRSGRWTTPSGRC